MAKTCCICDREFGENEAYLSIEIPYGNHGRMVELTYCEHSLPCQLKTLAVAEKYLYFSATANVFNWRLQKSINTCLILTPSFSIL